MSTTSASVIAGSNPPPRRWTTRAKLTALIGMAALASAALAGVGYFTRPGHALEAPSIPADPTSPEANPTQSSEPVTLPSEEAERSPPMPVPVRFTNPFDKTEVFEFPPGTSETEARDAVAAMLMERARQRRGGSAPLERVTSTNSPRHR